MFAPFLYISGAFIVFSSSFYGLLCCRLELFLTKYICVRYELLLGECWNKINLKGPQSILLIPNLPGVESYYFCKTLVNF